jgi:hypothetical protein
MSTRITTFEKSLEGKVTANTKNITTFEIPPAVKRNSGRPYKSTERDMYTRTLFRIFEQNEYLAYYAKPLTKKQIQERLLKEHKTNRLLKKKMDRYLLTVGMWRQRYNDGKLFSSQPLPYLISFEYDMYGRIVVGGRSPHSYRYFMDCYNKCIIHKIADPRFIPYDTIVEMRNRQLQLIPEWLEWIVPDEVTLKMLRRETGVKELYNSVKFPPGFTREETPSNFTALEE